MNENAEGEYNTGTTVADAQEQNKPFGKDTTIRDDLENEVRIPAGFKIAQDSATKVEDGIVIEDNDGNQFVWVPAKTEEGATIKTTLGDKTIVYKRTDFDDSTGKFSDFSIDACTENLSTDEEQSVNKWSGYYIGRFEAGDYDSTVAKDMIGGNSLVTNKVTIKKGQAPYIDVTINDAKTLAENMDSVQGYTGTTRLVSSYAWDTTLNFIKIKNEDYGEVYGVETENCPDAEFNYIDITTGEEQTKYATNVRLVPTGQHKSVSNIYDMGGNVQEFSSEIGVNENGAGYIVRGGYYGNMAYAVYRGGPMYEDDSLFTVGFRITLFCTPIES